jgi:hypothetical protein
MEKTYKRIIISLVVGAILITMFYAITTAITKYTGFSVAETDNTFENCLEEKEIILYINTNNAVETLKSQELFNYLQYFEIHNCNINNIPCIENKINSFPTWVINNQEYTGDMKLSKLEEISGCKII